MLVSEWDYAELGNRAVLLLRPRTPYVAWANGLEDGGPKISSDSIETVAYVVDDGDGKDDLERVLGRYARQIFEHQLASWDRDTDCWPKRRTLREFRQWFECTLCASVYHLNGRQ